MQTIKEMQKKYCSQAMFFSIGMATVLIIFGVKDFGKGLILGTFFSIINFVVMGQLIGYQLTESKTRVRASGLALLSILLRFSILAIPLIISFKIDAVNFVGTVVGIFMVQLTILFNNLVLDRFPSLRKA